jgi:hypothetical protein
MSIPIASSATRVVAPLWKLDARFPLELDLPTLAEVDVLVVGLGAAGVAAATVAAEAGKRVLAVEKYGFSGGAAVAGMSGTICGLYLATENPTTPEQVVYGFTERFRAELDRRGGLTRPQRYGQTFTSAHDPVKWIVTADALLISAGVRILFHTAVTGVLVEAGRICGAVVESNAGRSIIRSSRVIDASGDAAVAARAGVPYVFGDGGRIQTPTMFFRLAGVDVDAFLRFYGADTICPPTVTEMIEIERESGANLPRSRIWVFETPRPGELMVNATRVEGRDGRALNVIDPEDFTEAEIAGRQQVFEYAAFFARRIPGCVDSYVEDTGVEVGVRQTRSIVGAETLKNEDVLQARKRPDGICRVPWPIELHDQTGSHIHWLMNDYYEVPYLSLVPSTVENLIVAGRCLSAQHEALASARVTAQCFEYGHAAGVAACLSIDLDRPFRDIDGVQVRNVMSGNGSAL